MANAININRWGQFAKNDRVVGLDVMRVSMALVIFMFHSMIHFNCHYSFLNDFVSVGAIVMTGFFMLSGYSLRLVYGEYNLMDKKNLRLFYLKRIWGILPIYYARGIIHTLFFSNETLLDNVVLFPIETLGIQSTFSSLFNVSHNGGTWFISCLLIAYLLYPFLQSVVRQLTNRQKILLLFLLIFIDLWASVVKNWFHTATLYDNPFFRVMELASGLIIADLNLTTKEGNIIRYLRSPITMMISVLILIVGVSFVHRLTGTSDYMLLNWIVYPCFAVVFFSLGYIKCPLLEKSHALAYFSKISYPFFLVQFFAWRIGAKFIGVIGFDSNMMRIVVSLTLASLLAIVFYEVVQVRIVGLIKRKI